VTCVSEAKLRGAFFGFEKGVSPKARKGRRAGKGKEKYGIVKGSGAGEPGG